jgi:hypothetical protein
MVWYRKELPLVITFVVGVLVTLDPFLVDDQLHGAAVSLQDFATVLAAFALGLGAITLTVVHGGRIAKRSKGVFDSITLVVSLWIVVAVGLVFGVPSGLYQFQFVNVYTPLFTAVFALLAFFIMTAAYRSFTVRNLEATIFLLAGIFVVLRNAPVAEWLWSGFSTIGSWVLDVPNTAGQRGILIGAAIGVVALGVRVMLGLERGYLGGRE